jgi:hypothetical protein
VAGGECPLDFTIDLFGPAIEDQEDEPGWPVTTFLSELPIEPSTGQTMRCLDQARLCGSVLAVAVALTSIVSCSSSQSGSFALPGPLKITVYEGLPHPFYEAAKLAEESKKPTIQRGGFLFYRDPLALSEPDSQAIGTILANPRTFQPFSGEKKCGGFHPDYAVVLSAKGEEITDLICFGCGEAKVYRPDRSETRYDLGRDSNGRQLSTILKSYHKNRPMPIEGP